MIYPGIHPCFLVIRVANRLKHIAICFLDYFGLLHAVAATLFVISVGDSAARARKFASSALFKYLPPTFSREYSGWTRDYFGSRFATAADLPPRFSTIISKRIVGIAIRAACRTSTYRVAVWLLYALFAGPPAK